MSKINKPVPLYEDIRALVLSARQTIARGVDLLQVHTNYEIGRRIVENEQEGKDRAEYGRELLNDLAARLAAEFGNGFSVSNLRYMRQFYLTYPERAFSIHQTLSGELSALPNSQTVSGQSMFVPIPQTVSGELTATPNVARGAAAEAARADRRAG